jgi:hypothetical protein
MCKCVYDFVWVWVFPWFCKHVSVCMILCEYINVRMILYEYINVRMSLCEYVGSCMFVLDWMRIYINVCECVSARTIVGGYRVPGWLYVNTWLYMGIYINVCECVSARTIVGGYMSAWMIVCEYVSMWLHVWLYMFSMWGHTSMCVSVWVLVRLSGYTSACMIGCVCILPDYVCFCTWIYAYMVACDCMRIWVRVYVLVTIRVHAWLYAITWEHVWNHACI